MKRHAIIPGLALALLLPLLLAPAGCRSGIQDDPILRLSAAEALEQGKELMEREKYSRARRYLSHAFEVEPNSRAGREGLLLLADSYYLAGNEANWIQAEAKYRDFLNRFPTSEHAAYAQYQIANSLASRVEKPNRDQSSTYKALDAYRELLRLYPSSEYAEEAQGKIQEVRNRLADHEFYVGSFYLDYRYPAAAVSRLETLLERYPDYDERAKVLYHLGKAYTRSRRPEHRAKAADTFERLRSEHPDSEWIAKIPEELPQPPEEDVETADDGDGEEEASEPESEAER